MKQIDQVYIDAAKAAMAKYGVPASVSIAQGIIESGWFVHDLGVFNYFGIKYGSLSEQDAIGFIEKPTREVINGKTIFVNAKFCKFASPEQAFMAHARFIAEHPILSRAMKFKDDGIKFIAELQNGKVKYATDPNYVKLITDMINAHNLTQYDHS
jgi:flagellum-specific peptidoglycan hydrolase FlgJ